MYAELDDCCFHLFRFTLARSRAAIYGCKVGGVRPVPLAPKSSGCTVVRHRIYWALCIVESGFIIQKEPPILNQPVERSREYETGTGSVAHVTHRNIHAGVYRDLAAPGM